MSINGIAFNGVAKDYDLRTGSNGTAGSGNFASVLDDSLNTASVDLDALFESASVKYNVPVSLLKAVAKTESNFNPSATSACGAMGIMQLMPSTAESLGVTDAYDPEQNIMGGAKLLSRLLSDFGGNTELALAAYNAGAGNVIKYGGIPPFKETQSYVARVMSFCGSELTAGTVQAKERPIYASSGDTGSETLSGLFNFDAESYARLTQIKLQMRLLESNREDDEKKSAL